MRPGGTYVISGQVQVSGIHLVPDGSVLYVARGGELTLTRDARLSVTGGGALAISRGGRIINSGVVTLEAGAVHERLVPSANAFVNTQNGELRNESGTFDRYLTTAEAISGEPAVFKRGIDVSFWQDDIDWQGVANAGVEFAILRIGAGALTTRAGEFRPDRFDTRFHEYIAGAAANGIEVGVYWYSYARTVEAARREAAFLVEILGEVTQQWEISYPVVLDMEEEREWYTDSPSEMAAAFLEIIADAGYFPMLYSFRSWLDSYISRQVLDRYAVWVADWRLSMRPEHTDFPRNYYMWQYTEEGSVSGINGGVDLNVGFRDFGAFIRRERLNGVG
jgi:GH25 family lysozyme M1 (1,4-beta-N-acetylmuramidase)